MKADQVARSSTQDVKSELSRLLARLEQLDRDGYFGKEGWEAFLFEGVEKMPYVDLDSLPKVKPTLASIDPWHEASQRGDIQMPLDPPEPGGIECS